MDYFYWLTDWLTFFIIKKVRLFSIFTDLQCGKKYKGRSPPYKMVMVWIVILHSLGEPIYLKYEMMKSWCVNHAPQLSFQSCEYKVWPCYDAPHPPITQSLTHLSILHLTRCYHPQSSVPWVLGVFFRSDPLSDMVLFTWSRLRRDCKVLSVSHYTVCVCLRTFVLPSTLNYKTKNYPKFAAIMLAECVPHQGVEMIAAACISSRI